MSIIKKQDLQGKIVIDLTGEQGNANFLIAYANSLAKQLGFTDEERNNLKKQMTSGDYENLITVFDNNFGDYIDLAR
jgi:hypothetical protein